MNRFRQVIGFLGCVLVLSSAGCSSMSARKVVSLDRYQRIHVEHRLNDNHRLSEQFVAELRQLGREVSFGPMTMLPEKTDVVLTYDARWEWDFRNYLIELTFELHTVHPRKKLADARYHQPSLNTKSPRKVVHMLIAALFTDSSAPGDLLETPRQARR